MGKQVQSFLASNWVTLVMWLVGAGVGYGVHTVNMRWVDERISKIEKIDPAKTQWQVEENVRKLAALDSENKQTQKEISEIKAQISTINTKLDYLVDAERRRSGAK